MLCWPGPTSLQQRRYRILDPVASPAMAKRVRSCDFYLVDPACQGESKEDLTAALSGRHDVPAFCDNIPSSKAAVEL